MRTLCFSVFILVLPFFLTAQKSDAPKVIVGIVIDQMCYEYLNRFESRFSRNGFNKLRNGGTECLNTRYNYVPTYTGPGHASIYTGTTPQNHGIVANEWYEIRTQQVHGCVQDTNFKTVGSSSLSGACSPHYLKTATITDQLKLTYPNAKVVSISIKDRGAVLPGGHLSDGTYWFDSKNGLMVTSTFYKEEMPQWVQEFNQLQFPKKCLDSTWNTLYPIESYVASSSDDSPYEHVLSSKSKPTFPYHLKEISKQTDFKIFAISPFANTYLTDLAIKAMENEKLGLDAQTDFLAISYSTPDIAGHAFGPYAVEMEDMYLRLDLELARLIRFLEKQYGKNGFQLFLTADHAVVPVPHYLTDKKLPGGYLYLNEKLPALQKEVEQQFGYNFILKEENLNIYLDLEKMKALSVNKDLLTGFIAERISSWEGVKAAYTDRQLQENTCADPWKDMVAKGFYPEESGQLIFILEPGYLPMYHNDEKSHKGTSHGSAFNYDTHVPLVWYGKNIPNQQIYRSIEITDIAPTLAYLLRLQRFGAMTGEPILELFNH